jgi:UDP-sugar transporter A1/2/3
MSIKPRQLASVLWHEVVVHWQETAKVSIPALIYIIQNNLYYVAASNLDAASCQIAYQLKILTTAIFAVTMLGQSISARRWGALGVLAAGVALVQVPQLAGGAPPAGGDPALGFSAVLAACVASGFAGVYFEKVLQGSRTSLWIRNVQLAAVGGTLALVGSLCKDGAAIAAHGFFQGYTPLVWAVVAQVRARA